MVQTNDVARSPPAGTNRLDGIVRTAFGEIAEERIARPERQEAERGAPFRCRSGKKPIDDFEARAVATHSDEIAIAFCIRAVREHDSFAGRASCAHFDIEARGAKSFQRRRTKFPTAPTARRWIHDREVALVHKATVALRSSCLPICSARTMRLIFRAALRGKSCSQMTYPAMRL